MAHEPFNPFKGAVVVQLTTTEFYVAIPPAVRPGVYTVLTKPLTSADAFKVAKEMDGAHSDDWSPLTQDATDRPQEPPLMNRAAGKLRAKLRQQDAERRRLSGE
jgi:hypothetical protein